MKLNSYRPARSRNRGQLRKQALFFCRTPLQSMVAERLIAGMAGNASLVYHATSKSQKHLYYFNRVSCDLKCFIPWRPVRGSDTLSDTRAYMQIPDLIRFASYSELYAASIGSIPLSLLRRDHSRASFRTFDDGMGNVIAGHFARLIEEEPPLRRALKWLLGGVDNPTLARGVERHYTIFGRHHVADMDCEIEEIDLFGAAPQASGNGPRIRVLLGSWFPLPALQAKHDAIAGSGRFDLFLPHPADLRFAWMSSALASELPNLDLSSMVAEDVVSRLVEAGFRPTVYGFNSAALINLSGSVRVVNVVLDGTGLALPATLRADAGLREVRCGAPTR